MYVTFNVIFAVLSVYIKITKPIGLGSVKTCIHYAGSHVETYLDREIRLQRYCGELPSQL